MPLAIILVAVVLVGDKDAGTDVGWLLVSEASVMPTFVAFST
jgi:hypothetical protein